MSDTLDTIGKKLKGGEGRDAVHFAVAPVRAGEFLRVGDRVKFKEGTTDVVVRCDYEDEPVGIIDPFLDCYYVSDRDRCWLFLMPNSITGLRHEWTHPAFHKPASATQDQPAEPAKSYSERWLRGFAERYLTDYAEMIGSLEAGEGAFFGNDIEYSDFRHGTEFWQHVEAVTGKTFSEKQVQRMNFRCAC